MPVRVLLADDNAAYRLMLRTALRFDERIEVVAEAADGHEAVAAARSVRPDVIVLDVDMPVLDGLSALPKLRREAPSSKIVVLTASAVHRRDDAVAGGAHAFAAKGGDLTSLADLIIDLCD